MKTAGDILSTLFDEGFVKKAQGYSRLFDSWTDITAKKGIPSAAVHSRIKDLDRGILLVETDHPGWKQIIQTKQIQILNDFRERFPEMNISGISLMLSRGEPQAQNTETKISEEKKQQTMTETTVQPSADTGHFDLKGIEAIKDEDFRTRLEKLGQTVAARYAK